MAKRPSRSLQHLARLGGVTLSYRDIWGELQYADEKALRAALRALRVPCDSEAQIDRSIAQLHEARWQQPLPPVIIANEGEGVTFWVNIPAEESELTWRLCTEDNLNFEGRVALRGLVHKRQALVADKPFCRYRVETFHPLRVGYHALEINAGSGITGRARLIVSPRECYLPDGVRHGRKTWGVAVQLYSVVSQHNWGIGDFSDLRQVIDGVAEAGGGIVALSPLTALPLCNPDHVSPYSPQSRYALHPIYIDVERMDGFSESRECGELLQSDCVKRLRSEVRQGELVNYRAVYELKLLFFEALYRHFLESDVKADSELAQDFRSFCDWQGDNLRAYAVYEALQRHFGGCHLEWPEEFRRWKSSGVKDFAESHRSRVEFYLFLQWQAWKQLARLGEYSMHRSLAVGLYVDIPLGAIGGGAEVWMDPELFVPEASSGAPPDECNVKGQRWGLPPYHPTVLRERGYEPFIAMLRFAMAQAGAIRLDHVMGLSRLFWVSDETDPDKGVYVRYPLQELLAVIRLESLRNRCLVVGEDLGTVPQSVRDGMDRSAIFAYRLLMFMREADGSWLSPYRYPERCVAAFSSHDLPTIKGFWSSHDLMLREHFVVKDDPGLVAEFREQRENDKQEILAELSRSLGRSPREIESQLLSSINSFLLQSPSAIVLCTLEDVAGWVSQVNLPGVCEGYPSWRSKLQPALEELLPRFAELRHGG